MARQAIIYTRVSTDDQKVNGFSLQDQERSLKAHCRRENIEIAAHYQEDHSAKDFNRPAFQRMLSDVKEKRVKADLFLCVRWDRFSRSFEESLQMIRLFTKLGLQLKFIEGGDYDLAIPENKLIQVVLMALPQIENERRGLNTKVGMRQANREGRWTGISPKGYSWERHDDKSWLVPDENAIFIREAFSEIAKGIYSVQEVRKALNKKGMVCSKNQFYRILRNPVYMGKIKISAWRDEPEVIVEGLHDALITKELFDKVQSIMDGRKPKNTAKSKLNESLPLRGHLVCRICGGSLTGSASRSKNGVRHFYYHCNKGCKERFRADVANELFQSYLKSFQVPEEVLLLYYHILRDMFKHDDTDREQEIERLKSKVEGYQSKIHSVEDKYFDNAIDKATYDDARRRYKESINSLETKIKELQFQDSNFLNYAGYGLSLLGNLEGYYKQAAIEVKSKIVCSIFPGKLIFAEKKYRTPQVNKVLSLITSNNNHLGIPKKQKAANFDSLHLMASPGGIEPPL